MYERAGHHRDRLLARRPLLAVGGFHERCCSRPTARQLVAASVGLSERIESVRFSPDGSAWPSPADSPGRMGEVQVWDVEKREAPLSVPVTFDTVYGASWSPDGTKIAFGCARQHGAGHRRRRRAQVLFMGSHSDWASTRPSPRTART